MSRQSSKTVTYRDLLLLSERVLIESQKRYDGASARGTSSLEPLAHDVETARTMVRMMRKGMPGRQTNFFELFEQVK